jgi:hypothetical protein
MGNLSGCHTVNNASKQIMLFALLLHVSRVTATETEAKLVSKLFLTHQACLMFASEQSCFRQSNHATSLVEPKK